MENTNNPNFLTFNGEEYISIYFEESTKSNVGIELGFSGNLQWVRKRGDNFSTLNIDSKPEDAFSWLIVLELNCNNFYSSLRENLFRIENHLKVNGLQTSLILESFPSMVIVSCGLKTLTNNWTNLALDWLRDCLNDRLFAKEYLQKIINDKRIIQSVRHKAQSVLKHIK